MRNLRALSLITTTCFLACGPIDDADLAVDLNSISAREGQAILDLLNTVETTFEHLDDDAKLDRRAAANLIAHRQGPDGLDATSDDDRFDDLEEVDAVPYVGAKALEQLIIYAQSLGFTGAPKGDRETLILAVANDPAVTLEILDKAVRLDVRAARGIHFHRLGSDGLLNTADDQRFRDLASLDAVPYVGARALERLFVFAQNNGYGPETEASVAVVFSPQPYANSHNTRVAGLIDGAAQTIDIAMYSFSDESIFDALEGATARGVNVRFIYETANADRRKSEEDLARSRSARLERMGIDVRYVNKIMHHKLMIVDGPRDDLGHASRAQLVSGSGNWSYGAATRYDENTLFLSGAPELALRFQGEFDHLWSYSRDFIFGDAKPHVLSTVQIDEAAIEDGPDAHAYFTSDNFTVSGTTFRISTGLNRISDAMIAAIQAADTSIHIASGHLRSRPIAEALIAKAIAEPGVDVRVYLDGQEYISAGYNDVQTQEREDCVQAAGTSAAQVRRCLDRGFLYGYALEQAGIEVRYKYYSYRWHYTYAVQMHHKYMVVDGDELWTGSYNLSDNAEHNTFENMVVLRGERFAGTVAEYTANFESMWISERDASTYADLLSEVATASSIPLVFSPMALTWSEVTDLKAAIRSNCGQINSEPFRTRPEANRFCPRIQ